MNKPRLPPGIKPEDRQLAGHEVAVTILTNATDGSTLGLVSLRLKVTTALDPDGKPITLPLVRMAPHQARTLAEALTTWAALAEDQTGPRAVGQSH